MFDFPLIRSHLSNFPILINSLHGATGSYANKIFLEELGCPPSSCIKR